MLTEPMKELLTAFVDGELSQRQRKAVMRLLQRSSEARELVKELQENAHRIKQLPRRSCDPSLVDEILQAIADRQAEPAQPARTPRRRWAPYIAVPLAASILLAIAGIVYWQAKQDVNKDPVGPIAKQPEKSDTPNRDVTPPLPPPRKVPNPLIAKMVDETFGAFAAPIIEPRAFTASFSELRHGDKGVASSQLTHELNKERVVQLEITVKNNALAMDHLRSVMKAREIAVTIDPAAGKTLANKNQAKVEYLVYAENLTSEEVTRLMGELGQSIVISQGNKQKTVESPYKQVAVAPIAADSRTKLAKLLGVAESAIEPKTGKPAKVDPKRSRAAVVLPTNTAGTPSAEVRRFVNERRPQAGTMQVLIRIRQE